MLRITDYLSKYEILSLQQFGFQRGKSAVDAIISFTEDLYASLNKGNYTMSLFLDLKKAFDTVNHDILLSKLHHYGIRGVSYQWLKNYLSNRKQHVKIGSCKSSSLNIKTGVPQGSILGPLLFLIFINDLPKVSNLSAVLFADDTTLYQNDSHQTNLIKYF